jgi:pSer/pThr/pTyr-binding forkhead associated (FHA) protein
MVMREPVSTPLLAWLAVTEGPGAPRGQVYTLQEETVIGRKVGQILLSNDAYVSGQHAKIRLEYSEADEDKQVFVLYDLASANGTFAGDREDYEDNQVYRHELEDGDFLLLGETTLVFKQVDIEGDE